MLTNYAHQTEHVEEQEEVAKVDIDEINLVDGLEIEGAETQRDLIAREKIINFQP